jgi:hypothetical protein
MSILSARILENKAFILSSFDENFDKIGPHGKAMKDNILSNRRLK